MDVIGEMEKLNVNQHHLVVACGHDVDTHKQLIEDLYSLADNYNLDDPYKEYAVH